MRAALAGLARYIATPHLTKHRLFVWLAADTLAGPASSSSFARDDDYTFGVLHSRVHELWARRMGTQLRDQSAYATRPRPASRPSRSRTPRDEQRARVGEAARRLVELRDGWLNPPGLAPADLAKRTLTNLYNQRPTWLANAHAALDAAVLAAYGWPADLADTEILERLLALNRQRAGESAARAPHEVST